MGGKVPAKAGAPLTDSSGMPFATSNARTVAGSDAVGLVVTCGTVVLVVTSFLRAEQTRPAEAPDDTSGTISRCCPCHRLPVPVLPLGDPAPTSTRMT